MYTRRRTEFMNITYSLIMGEQTHVLLVFSFSVLLHQYELNTKL